MTPPTNVVLVDTSAWICFFAHKNFPQIKKWLAALLEQDRVAIIGPIFLELIQGTRNQKERKETESRLKVLHWFRINDNHWQQAADLGFRLRRKGITISAIDAIISVVAINYPTLRPNLCCRSSTTKASWTGSFSTLPTGLPTTTTTRLARCCRPCCQTPP